MVKKVAKQICDNEKIINTKEACKKIASIVDPVKPFAENSDLP